MGGHFGAKGSSLNDRGAGARERRFNYASESPRSGTWSHRRHTESCKPNKTKQNKTTLSPYAKIVTSRSLASGTLAHHPLHRTQRRRRELGRRTASRESADSLPPRATLFLTTSNFSEEPGLAPPPEAIEHPPLQAAIGTDRVSRLEGHTAIKARGCALVLNYRN